MASGHLRYAGLSDSEQRRTFLDIVLADPIVSATIAAACELDLPDWLVVSGVLYNAVWNALTGRPPGHGTKDIDLFYFDDTDLSYAAEDAVIRRAEPHFTHLPLPVEIRNQARVHLWYPQKFGRICPRYRDSAHSLAYFASTTHAVGLRVEADGMPVLVAPFGLEPVFAFRVVPNHSLDNEATHLEKGVRAKRMWPEVTVEPW